MIRIDLERESTTAKSINIADIVTVGDKVNVDVRYEDEKGGHGRSLCRGIAVVVRKRSTDICITLGPKWLVGRALRAHCYKFSFGHWDANATDTADLVDSADPTPEQFEDLEFEPLDVAEFAEPDDVFSIGMFDPKSQELEIGKAVVEAREVEAIGSIGMCVIEGQILPPGTRVSSDRYDFEHDCWYVWRDNLPAGEFSAQELYHHKQIVTRQPNKES